jgi:large subunit ribosomal protein L6
MSRVGKKPIEIPKGVEVLVRDQSVSAKGPKGELTADIHPLVSVVVDEKDGVKTVLTSITDEKDHSQNAQWGTARSIIANMIDGVSEGFTKQLEVNGVGYRVNLQGNTIVLNVGYSHDVPFTLPDGIQASVEGNIITLTGADKQRVGEAAANIRKIRKPEPYKGKGIKYIDEVIRRKAGKSQKGGDK